MRVIKPSTARTFWVKHPDAEGALKVWLKITRAAYWHSLQDVRETYSNADSAKVASDNTVTIFNVCGNKYRLVVSIKYRSQTVYVREFLTHAQYNNQLWKRRH